MRARLRYLRWLAGAWRAVYLACRADWPCEGCEQYRLQAALNATRWVFDEVRA